jgi:hypothetical protein
MLLLLLEIGVTSLLLSWSMWENVIYTTIGLLTAVLILVVVVSASNPGIINKANLKKFEYNCSGD